AVRGDRGGTRANDRGRDAHGSPGGGRTGRASAREDAAEADRRNSAATRAAAAEARRSGVLSTTAAARFRVAAEGARPPRGTRDRPGRTRGDIRRRLDLSRRRARFE